MSWLECIYVALKGLGVHKIRTFLSMLGIIFGIASVVAMLSIGEGARYEVKRQIEAMGVNNIRIREVQTDQETRKRYRLLSPGLSLEDAINIGKNCPGVRSYAPMIIRKLKAISGENTIACTIVGTTPKFIDVSSTHLQKGRFINPIDANENKRVCVLGYQIYKELFPFSKALGKQILLHHEYYTIIGIMAPKEGIKSKKKVFDISELNRRIYIPIPCALYRLTRTKIKAQINEISVRTKNTKDLAPTAQTIHKIFESSHAKQQDYEVIVALELLIQSQKSQRIFDIVMGSIAGISLLVGGIGIMNIMLANVSERRREIGIRRAVGALQRDIRRQFLLEALFVCLLGGVLGIFLGIVLAGSITYFFNWKTVISTWGIVLSLSVSLLDGLIFGTYPAWKAARMDPIDALSVE